MKIPQSGIFNFLVDQKYYLPSLEPNTTKFANEYETLSLLKIPLERYKYVYNVLYTEGQFIKPGISYDDNTGITYDGHYLDPETWELTLIPRNWSSPAKEVSTIFILKFILKGIIFAFISSCCQF